MDKRFFGPVTPFVTVAASAVSLLAYTLLWAPGLVLDILLFLAGAIGMYAHGKTRHICTGVAIGTLFVLGGLAIAFFVVMD
ncbi:MULTISPECIES: hypothetical protein [Gordonia]|jgi:hypothetical protein|uniref:hypothetical protein n=1 Tax=Gordonia TaxID=2053 RepID=UPI00055303E1|nr:MULTISPECIES: hypothetical protein [Gordonia]MDH3008933.1 hypothetical protein [Gordonia alkanivorans]MDH3012470.1 hypothetical protein [Gordonia alkanivorans]MDH3017894.1 hypothetical protein [Gordonia alkanivorans]MDH3022413.1 hypothetical protein [Gordonia alkanivorans]MDH3026813.1 hypothetical protein [Gordonia alkanivorans]